MSIPKEPRQLMINIMYLVLTAMLALNVSAEIINAFFDLDKSLLRSAEIADTASKTTKDGIAGMLKKKPALKKPLYGGMDATKQEVDEFIEYIESIKDTLITATGGLDEKTGKPKGKKDKDITTRVLVMGGKGDELEGKIKDIKKKLVDIYRRSVSSQAVIKEKKWDKLGGAKKNINKAVSEFESSLLMEVDSAWTSTDKTSWADYKFRQMPLAAVLPTLSKLQSDARNAQADVNNRLAGIIGSFEIKLDKFFPVINAKNGYVIQGEKFEAEVAVGAYSSQFAKSTSITVNGRSIPLNSEGKGTYTETAGSVGKKTLKLNSVVKNPLTGEVMKGSSSFEYEVGRRSANVSADKMNVFYVGVDNPVSLTASGVSSNKLRASCSGGGCSMSGSGAKRTVRVSQPGAKATITLSGGGLTPTNFEFRVKRIPDPVPCFRPGGEGSGSMGNGAFKAMQGVLADLRNFDFEARCKLMGFELTKVPKRQDPITAINPGARYSGRAQNLVNSAKPGDIYYYDKIKAMCPGDKSGRKLPGMVWKIK